MMVLCSPSLRYFLLLVSLFRIFLTSHYFSDIQTGRLMMLSLGSWFVILSLHSSVSSSPLSSSSLISSALSWSSSQSASVSSTYSATCTPGTSPSRWSVVSTSSSPLVSVLTTVFTCVTHSSQLLDQGRREPGQRCWRWELLFLMVASLLWWHSSSWLAASLMCSPPSSASSSSSSSSVSIMVSFSSLSSSL